MSDKTHVPDKLHGYTLQVRHMLYELISLDLDKIVSIEAFEDVAVEDDEVIVAEQLKSSLSSNSPISNRSEVFWKTIYNWCRYMEDSSLPKKNIVFKFVVIANHMIQPGKIAKAFCDAASDSDAEAALNFAMHLLWGDKLDKKDEMPETYKEYLDYIFEIKRKNVIIGIIKSIQIDVYSGTYDEILYKKFISQVIPPEYKKELFTYMLGWVNDRVNGMTKEGKPAFIRCGDFRDALQAQIRCYDLNTILAVVSTQPTMATAQMEMDRHDTYIKQLELINLEMEKKLRAASDVLRTNTEKTEWAERGLVALKSFDTYEEALVRLWNNDKTLLPFQYPGIQDDIQKGQFLYTLCQKDVSSIKVQGKEIPEFFGPGYLNLLANEPMKNPKIGWHPNYIKLLNEVEDE